MDFIFHKLFYNTKHIQFQFYMNPKILFEMSYEFIFLIYFENLLNAITWLKLCKGWRKGCQNVSLLYPQNIHFYENFGFFQENLQNPKY
jgi:hypothetical protein